MQLPKNLPLSLMQTLWSSVINPVLANPMTNMTMIPNVKLINGTTVIPHLLGKVQQGWVLVDVQGAATIYRNSPFNKLTLSLSSSAAVTVSLGVF